MDIEVAQEGFVDGVAEELQWYVYALIDPDSGQPVYVGKGAGPRVFAHVHEVLKSGLLEDRDDRVTVRTKLARIRSILEVGGTVKHCILRHGLESEDEAWGYEAIAIDAYRLAGIEVANEVRGHGTRVGIATVAELNARFGCTQRMEKDSFQVPAVLYRLNPYNHNWTSEEVFERIKCCWPAAKWRRDRLEVACAVSDHVIRAVFRIDRMGWHESSPGFWRFSKKPMEADDPARTWLRGNVRHLFENEKGRNKARVRMMYVGPWGRQEQEAKFSWAAK